jgi:hypothetical protein
LGPQWDRRRFRRGSDRRVKVINAFDRAPRILIAIIDTWLSLLPELTAAGVDWLATLMPVEQNEGS